MWLQKRYSLLCRRLHLPTQISENNYVHSYLWVGNSPDECLDNYIWKFQWEDEVWNIANYIFWSEITFLVIPTGKVKRTEDLSTLVSARIPFIDGPNQEISNM